MRNSIQPRHNLILACLLLFARLASAEPLRLIAERDYDHLAEGFWNLQIENDIFTLSNEDKYYTNGLQFDYMLLDDSFSPHDWILNHVLDRNGYAKSAIRYSVGQKIFTPRDNTQSAAQPTDRPYAGWLYFNFGSDYLVEHNSYYDIGQSIDFTVGVVGPSAQGEEVQSGFHEWIDSSEPAGWEHQLQDEPGLMITTSTRWHLTPRLFHGIEYDVSPHTVAALGNVYTYVGGGATLRIGSNLVDDLGPPNIRPGFPGSSGFGASKKSNAWYFFAGHESRVVLRNIFLDGNTFRDSPSVDKETLVGDFQFGFVYRFEKIRLTFSNVIRTKEFEGQEYQTQFGAIGISASL